MKEIKVTFLISSFDFSYIWSLYTKEGGAFNEFLVNYYIEEIAKKFPKAESVTPKLYLTIGEKYPFLRLLCGARSKDGYDYGRVNAEKLEENFFVSEDEIINGIEVGI